jgi:hypothetical protein
MMGLSLHPTHLLASSLLSSYGFFFFFFGLFFGNTGPHCIAQTGPHLLGSVTLLVSASQVAETTGTYYHTQYIMFLLPLLGPFHLHLWLL